MQEEGRGDEERGEVEWPCMSSASGLWWPLSQSLGILPRPLLESGSAADCQNKTDASSEPLNQGIRPEEQSWTCLVWFLVSCGLCSQGASKGASDGSRRVPPFPSPA